MSLNKVPLPVVSVYDEAIKPITDFAYSVLKSGENNTYRQIQASSYSDSNITYTFDMPIHVALKRVILQVWEVLFTFSAPSPVNGGVGNMVLDGSTDSPRSFPVARATNVNSLTINGKTTTLQVSDSFSAMQHLYTSDDELRSQFSLTPDMLDNCQSYTQTFSTNINPLGNQGVNPYQQPRGCFALAPIAGNSTNANQSGTRIYRFVEPVFMPALSFKDPDMGQQALYPINQLTLNVQLQNGLGPLMWSHNNVNQPWPVGSTVTAHLNATPYLLFNTITINQLHPMPPINMYPFYDIQQFYQNIANTPAYSDTNLPATPATLSQVLNLTSIPSRLVVFAQQRRSEKTVYDTDSFMSLNTISITLGNKPNLLSNATQFDLYNMSRRHLKHMSFQDWSGLCRDSVTGHNYGLGAGSIGVFEFGRDIELPADQSIGSYTNSQLQVQATFSNVDPIEVRNYELVVLLIYSGILTVGPNTADNTDVILSVNDVLYSKPAMEITQADVAKEDILGGGVSVGSIIKKLPHVLRAASNIGKTIGAVAHHTGDALSALGYGGEDIGGDLLKEYHHMGGKRLSRSKMAARLR